MQANPTVLADWLMPVVQDYNESRHDYDWRRQPRPTRSRRYWKLQREIARLALSVSRGTDRRADAHKEIRLAWGGEKFVRRSRQYID